MAEDGFRVVVDTATPRLRALARRFTGAQGARFLMRWGARVRVEAQTRAIAKGGRRFWRDVARSIDLRLVGDRVQVGAYHVAARQKQEGGPIRAKGKAAGGADWLTIPISEEAEGQRAAKFALAGITLYARRGLLGYDSASAFGVFTPLYALRRETAPQDPEPFFPFDDEVADMGADEAVRMIDTRRRDSHGKFIRAGD